MAWELVGAAMAGALIGGLVAAVIQLAGKKKSLPMWPVMTGAILFMLSRFMLSS